MSASYSRIADLLVGIGQRMTYSGKMVGDCLDRDIRGVGDHLTAHTGRLLQEDEHNRDLIGGIAADTDFFSGIRAWNETSEPYTLRSGLDSGRIKFHDFYAYVERSELPERISVRTAEGSDWIINRAWGRAVAAKRDHLQEQGVTGRDFDEAMWKWRDEMERQAREEHGRLEFPTETRSREPHLGELYRGDARPMETIYAEGFQPRASKWWIDLDGPDAAGWVCTSRDPAQAARFPLGYDGETYVVQDVRGAHDRAQYPKGAHEKLVVVEGIPADKVKGMLIDRHDPDKGLVPNPDFKPYETAPVRPPREDTGWDNVIHDPDTLS
ncbi:hypothetical protein [Nocardia otitidiscaviarum]|uniref:hypothetical protein n=1 Tax=Nocardia otitidiscaviarum TaxID=1823 RepID=UPI002453C23D|nr:hypothetical protein [Nocardia otitidiscaviarum]